MKKLYILAFFALVFTTANAAPHYRTIGNPKAKVEMVEYASFTCPHCANFNEEVMAEVHKKYIATNKIKYTYKDFPLDGLAFGASILSHCIENDKAYFGFVDVVFKQQKAWMNDKNPKDLLLSYLGFAGVSPEKADACLKDETIVKFLQNGQNEAGKIGINSTPSILINGKKIDPIKEDVFKALDAALK